MGRLRGAHYRVGQNHKLTAMVDVFNATNGGAVTSFRTTRVNYREVTGILDPRIVRFGVRFDF
jgi:hypothetical protein